MKLIKYGITFKRLREDDIEEVRRWRNSPRIRDKMEYREYITPEMQKKWFDSINNLDNFYYVIIYKGEKIGLLSEKKAIFEGMDTTESGLFMADTKYLKSHIPVFISLILPEAGFYFHKGTESFIRVLKDNHEAISYNKSLGYVLCDGQEDVYNQLYILTRENFEKKTRKIRKAALRLSDGDNRMYLLLDRQDYEEGIGQYYEKLIAESDVEVEEKKSEVEGEKIFFIDFDKVDKSK